MGGEQGGEEMHQHPRPEQLQPGLLGDTELGTVGYMLLLTVCLAVVVRRFLNVADLCKQD